MESLTKQCYYTILIRVTIWVIMPLENHYIRITTGTPVRKLAVQPCDTVGGVIGICITAYQLALFHYKSQSRTSCLVRCNTASHPPHIWGHLWMCTPLHFPVPRHAPSPIQPQTDLHWGSTTHHDRGTYKVIIRNISPLHKLTFSLLHSIYHCANVLRPWREKVFNFSFHSEKQK